MHNDNAEWTAWLVFILRLMALAGLSWMIATARVIIRPGYYPEAPGNMHLINQSFNCLLHSLPENGDKIQDTNKTANVARLQLARNRWGQLVVSCFTIGENINMLLKNMVLKNNRQKQKMQTESLPYVPTFNGSKLNQFWFTRLDANSYLVIYFLGSAVGYLSVDFSTKNL